MANKIYMYFLNDYLGSVRTEREREKKREIPHNSGLLSSYIYIYIYDVFSRGSE